MRRLHPIVAGTLQAAGIVLYILLLTSFVFNDRFEPSTPLQPLLLFCFSVLYCAVVTCGYPLFLLLHRKIKDAFVTIISMLVTLGVLLVAFLFVPLAVL